MKATIQLSTLPLVRFHKHISLGKKATIRQLTNMLSTSKNVLFPGHNHLLINSADDPSL